MWALCCTHGVRWLLDHLVVVCVLQGTGTESTSWFQVSPVGERLFVYGTVKKNGELSGGYKHLNSPEVHGDVSPLNLLLQSLRFSMS